MGNPSYSFDVTVVIVSFNAKDYLDRCLSALYQNAGTVTFETIVVDNASSDGSPEMVAGQFPQVRLIRNFTNQYFSKANNQGFRQSRGEFTLLLNPDTEIRPNALTVMAHYFRENPKVGIIGPRLVYPDGKYQVSCYRHARWLWGLAELSLLNGVFPNSPVYRAHCYPESFLSGKGAKEVEVVTAACLMIRSVLLKSLDLMDEHYVLYGEEIDLCRRAQEKGYEVVYLPAAEVMHHIGRSTSLLPPRFIHDVGAESLLYFYKKFYSIWTYAFFLSIYAVSSRLYRLKKAVMG